MKIRGRALRVRVDTRRALVRAYAAAVCSGTRPSSAGTRRSELSRLAERGSQVRRTYGRRDGTQKSTSGTCRDAPAKLVVVVHPAAA